MTCRASEGSGGTALQRGLADTRTLQLQSCGFFRGLQLGRVPQTHGIPGLVGDAAGAPCLSPVASTRGCTWDHAPLPSIVQGLVGAAAGAECPSPSASQAWRGRTQGRTSQPHGFHQRLQLGHTPHLRLPSGVPTPAAAGAWWGLLSGRTLLPHSLASSGARAVCPSWLLLPLRPLESELCPSHFY